MNQKYLCQDVDILRIDHFRGFESYWAVPFGAEDARGGEWEKAPGLRFFRALQEKLGTLPLIAEDLGFITEEVRALMVGYKKGRYCWANLIRQTCAMQRRHSKVKSHRQNIVRIIAAKRYSYILYCNRAG